MDKHDDSSYCAHSFAGQYTLSLTKLVSLLGGCGSHCCNICAPMIRATISQVCVLRIVEVAVLERNVSVQASDISPFLFNYIASEVFAL